MADLKTKTILARKKPTALRTYFQRLAAMALPKAAHIPQDPEEAFKAGFKAGCRKGYEDGLVDGADLGVEVLSESLNLSAETAS